MSFESDDVAVTLKGREWFAILARMRMLAEKAAPLPLEGHEQFSRKGAKIYSTGIASLQDQILRAASNSQRRPTKNAGTETQGS